MNPFDPSTLHTLVDDAQAQPFILELAGTFRHMLEQRVARVVTAVLAGDPDEAMDAVLSLKVSARMTGATELAELTAFIEVDLRSDDLLAARAQTLLLPAAARRAESAIDDYLAHAASHTDDIPA